MSDDKKLTGADERELERWRSGAIVHPTMPFQPGPQGQPSPTPEEAAALRVMLNKVGAYTFHWPPADQVFYEKAIAYVGRLDGAQPGRVAEFRQKLEEERKLEMLAFEATAPLRQWVRAVLRLGAKQPLNLVVLPSKDVPADDEMTCACGRKIRPPLSQVAKAGRWYASVRMVVCPNRTCRNAVAVAYVRRFDGSPEMELAAKEIGNAVADVDELP